jgi:hypothetical protein
VCVCVCACVYRSRRHRTFIDKRHKTEHSLIVKVFDVKHHTRWSGKILVVGGIEVFHCELV